MRRKTITITAAAMLFLPTIAQAQPSEGRGIYHRDDFKDAAADIKASRGLQPRDPDKVEPFSKLRETDFIDMYPGTVMQWHLDEYHAFKAVVLGNEDVASVTPTNNATVLIVAKAGGLEEGHTNFLVLDEEDTVIANVRVTVMTSNMRRDEGKVEIHNKKNNLTGYTNYKCNNKGCIQKDFSDDKARASQPASPVSTPPSININATNVSTNMNTNTQSE